MPRKKTLYRPNANGTVTASVVVPNFLWRFAEELQADIGLSTPTAAFEYLLKELAVALETDRTLVPEFFSANQRAVLNRLRNIKTVESMDDGIDDNLLHTSEKTQSGFVGVYTNGKGFRAVVPDTTGTNTSGQKMLGTFPTARLAAWRRLQYFQERKLPYGALADAIEKRLIYHPGEPLGKLKHLAIWDSADAGRPIPGLSIEDRHLEHVDPFDGSADYDGPNVIVKPRKSPAPRAPVAAPVTFTPVAKPVEPALTAEITPEVAKELTEQGLDGLKAYLARHKNLTEEEIAAAHKLARPKVIPFPKAADPTPEEIAAHLARRPHVDEDT